MSSTTATGQELAQNRYAPGLLGLVERGLVPDALLRLGIRRLRAQRLREECAGGLDAQAARLPAAHRGAAAQPAEMFGYADGQEWLVAHYRFARP